MTPPFGLPGGEGYDFDAGGNRQGSGGTPQSATGTHNQLQTDGVYNYFYDGEGNLIRRESLSNAAATLYEWDHRNRLVSVKEAPFYQVGPIYQNMIARRIEYIYDAFDQRVGRRIEDTGAGYGIWGIEWKRYEAYVWADGQEVLRFTDSDGLESAEPFRLANRYLWSNQVDQLLAEEQYTGNSGPAIGAPAAHPSEGETFWPLTDHLGSVRGLVDNNGVIRQHVTYDSFGNRLVEQHYDSAGAPVAASHAEAVDTLFGYTGRAWDADTGLQYNRARWYNPSTGRWLSQDPIGFSAGDANLYRYTGNQPTTRTDPSGLDWFDDFSYWWTSNQERREQEYQQRVEEREWFENAVRGRQGVRVQRQLAERGIDAGSMHIFGDVWFKNPDMGSGIFERLERECLYLATGLTQDEAVLRIIKGTIEASGQKILYGDDFYLNHPGRWPFDAAVGMASNPLTYPSVLVTGGGIVQGGRRMLALKGTGTVTVTHWGPVNMTYLRSGDWVMTGPPPRYLLSGKCTLNSKQYVPFDQRIQIEVPRSSLMRPSGYEGVLKYPLGQRIYVGPDIPATKINTPSPQRR